MVHHNLERQLETFKQNDAYAQLLNFTESLVSEVTSLSAQLKVTKDDLDDHNAMRREWKCRAEAAQSLISKNAFVLILIDGNECIFDESYLANAQTGGGEAAHRLMTQVRDYVKAAQSINSSSSYEILVTVYANKQGLTRALQEAGIISSNEHDLENFFCKFSQSQAHFQFVDCGSGKERVDAKIRETYRFFLQDCHCKLIFLALGYNNGYIAELDKYRNDPTARQKTRLVDCSSKDRVPTDMPFPMVNLWGVFSTRAHPTSSSVAPPAPPSRPPAAATRTLSHAQVREPGPGSNSTPPPWVPPQFRGDTQPPTPNGLQQIKIADLSIPSGRPDGDLLLSTEKDQIPINRLNERIDLPISIPTPPALHRFEARISQHKLCNTHHLRGPCPDNNCQFDHSPIGQDLHDTLRFVARKIVCRSGSACRRADCFFGHICPFPACQAKRCPFAKVGLHDVKDWEVVRFVGNEQ